MTIYDVQGYDTARGCWCSLGHSEHEIDAIIQADETSWALSIRCRVAIWNNDKTHFTVIHSAEIISDPDPMSQSDAHSLIEELNRYNQYQFSDVDDDNLAATIEANGCSGDTVRRWYANICFQRKRAKPASGFFEIWYSWKGEQLCSKVNDQGVAQHLWDTLRNGEFHMISARP